MVRHPSTRLLTLEPIGHVENEIRPGEHVIWEEIDSRIVLDEEWADGLEGLEQFSHIVVIFWLDRPSDTETPLKVHPEGKQEMPLVGLFATRTPLRPNPLAVTSVHLLSVEGHTLLVRGLDAFHGTPVLDIKPYLIRGDCKANASVPAWLQRLWEQQDAG